MRHQAVSWQSGGSRVPILANFQVLASFFHTMTNAIVDNFGEPPLLFQNFVLTSAASLDINKAAYVPPHLRSQQRAASASGNPSWSSPQKTLENKRPAFSNRSFSSGTASPWTPSSPRSESPRESFGFGAWRDGKHLVGARNHKLERELFGDPNDPSKQHTGINFEKYDDIPVEATGSEVPEPVTNFTSPPLDPVLLENITYSRYTTPTPVQKYSIPIVANGRDLMACAQVRAPPTEK